MQGIRARQAGSKWRKICEYAWEGIVQVVDNAPNDLYVELEMTLWMFGSGLGSMVSCKMSSQIYIVNLWEAAVGRRLWFCGEFLSRFYSSYLLICVKGRCFSCCSSWTIVVQWLVCLLDDPNTEYVSASGNFVVLVWKPDVLAAPVSMVVLCFLFHCWMVADLVQISNAAETSSRHVPSSGIQRLGIGLHQCIGL